MVEERALYNLPMMRVGLGLILILWTAGGFAQTRMTIKEDFSANHRGWLEYQKDQNFIAVRDGVYIIDSPESGWVAYASPDFIGTEDFTLEATFALKGGAENMGFGFVWGYSFTGSKFNNFVIAETGYAKVFSSDTSRTDAKGWKKIESVKRGGIPNRLKIIQKAGIMYFFVNDTEVTSIPALPWFGKSIGFISQGKMRVMIDDVEINFSSRIKLPPEVKVVGKENLGTAVNSSYNDIDPIITLDGKKLFFNRRETPENTGGSTDEGDIWYSELRDDNTWSPAINMGAPINSATANNLLAVSQDNNSLYLAKREDIDLYQNAEAGWSRVGPIGLVHSNESNYFVATLTANGKAILFAAKNKQNLFYSDVDERDLFVSLKDENGKWGAPINLGSTINTSENDDTPFLAADDKTLYFASEGHPGYGKHDIFMSKRLDDTWTNWSTPVNLGPSINTFRFDAYYTIPASGDYAYLCTSTDGAGLSDIVRINLKEIPKPDPVVLVLGTVLNAKTNKPVVADIVFEDLNGGVSKGEATSNAKTGQYRVVLPYGTNYGLHAKAKGFVSVNENLELVNFSTYTEVQKNLLLVPIEVGEAIQLNNVFFEQGKPALQPESYLELDRLVQILNENPTMEIELAGHTDNLGNPTSLVVLSQNRVGTVKKYLVSKGINANRITGQGFGGKKPLVKNDTEEHRKMNRRVEFKIVKK
jgi:outer membrane protein OmpA-like peptidoglycan-associated protein